MKSAIVKKKVQKTSVPQQDAKNQIEVKRILAQNSKKLNLDESSMPFVTRFLTNLLKEAELPQRKPSLNTPPPEEGKNPDDFTPDANKDDFQGSLEPTTDPNQFDIDGVDPQVSADNINQVKKWAEKLDEFSNFLNDPENGDSLHRILADNDKAGSLIRGVTRKASDSITRIAGEVEKLKEVLNSFVIMAPKKARDLETRQ